MSDDDSEFGQVIHALAKMKPNLPTIDKKSDVGRYLFNLGQTQYLYQPWYAKYYKFWGNPFKKIYYARSFKIFFSIFIILSFLIIIPPLKVVSVPYPITTTQNINFSSNSSLDFNNYISNSAFLSKGNVISYKVSANQPFSFAISDKPFTDLPVTGNYYTNTFNAFFNLQGNQFHRYQIYLHKDDSIKYFNTASVTQPLNSTGFYISNNNNINGSVDFESYYYTNNLTGTFTSPKSQYYYLYWEYFGDTSSPRDIVSTSIQYNVSSTSLHQTDLNYQNTTAIAQNSFTAPSSGTYYYYLYYNPTNINQSMAKKQLDFSSTIIFYQNLSANDHWIQISNYLLIISIIMVLVIILTYFVHIYARKFEKAKKIYYSDYSLNRACYRCRELQKEGSIYCLNCGAPLTEVE